MNILCTGSFGFVGLKLCGNLMLNRHTVIFFDLPDYDIGKKEDITYIFDRCQIDGVIHLAAISRVKDCEKDIEKAINVNIIGTENLLKEMKAKWLIFASTYRSSDNDSVYVATKGISEKVCFLYRDKFNIKILRLPDIYGEGDNPDKVVPTLERKLTNKEKVILNKPNQRFNLMHIDEVVNRIVDIVDKLEHNNKPDYEIVEFNSNYKPTLKQLADRIKKEGKLQ